VDTGASYINDRGERVYRTTSVDRLANVDDAHKLSSGTQIARIYADHSNKLKALANQARLDYTQASKGTYDPNARKVYAKEVESLNAQLARAKSNAPLERMAQVAANAIVRAKRDSDPTMTEATLKKVKSQALQEARERVGANKEKIVISDNEWRAIQAGAISPTKLASILDNADPKQVRELATPRESLLMNSAKSARAALLLDRGYTRAEVAQDLGVSITTLDRSLDGE
jgi:hypothetical protein